MERRKAIATTVKSVGDESERVLRFIGSTESADRDGDIVSVSGWDLKNYMLNPVIMYGHDYSGVPVGKAKAVSVDKRGKQLIFDVQFPKMSDMSTDPANASDEAKFIDTVYHLAKNGYLNATSVGFRALESKQRDDDEAKKLPEWQRGFNITRQELFELSIVPIPANPEALQVAKSFSPDGAAMLGMISKCGMIEDAVQSVKSGRRISAASRAKLEAAMLAIRELMGDDEMPEEEDPKGIPSPEAWEENGVEVLGVIDMETFVDLSVGDAIKYLRMTAEATKENANV